MVKLTSNGGTKASSRLVVILAMVITVSTAQNSPQDYVNRHNFARAAVGVGPVTWNTTVAAYAQVVASQRASDCELFALSGGPYGENVFAHIAEDNATGVEAVDAWVKQRQFYDYGKNRCADGTRCREYTQVVWSDSTVIGCAREHLRCGDNGGVVVVCSYKPPGNIKGQRPYSGADPGAKFANMLCAIILLSIFI